MSYLFGNTGGTTWGLKTYNQIFALNSETVGAAEYWDKSNVQNYDTVICSTNNKLLTAYYRNGDSSNELYWYGAGIYLMQNMDTDALTPGDYLIAYYDTSSSPSTNYPFVQKYGGGGNPYERCVGVALSAGTAFDERNGYGGPVMVATFGVWPCKIRIGTSYAPRYGDHVQVYLSSSTYAGLVRRNTSAGYFGLIGKCYDETAFPIFIDSQAEGEPVDGRQILLWTASETD